MTDFVNNFKQPVVFIDGECLLCHRLALFLLRYDRSETLAIASLQSEAGEAASGRAGISAEEHTTLIFLLEGRFYTRSQALLKISEFLPWYVFLTTRLFCSLPGRIPDNIYSMVAGHRHGFSDKKKCGIFPEQYRDRIIR